MGLPSSNGVVLVGVGKMDAFGILLFLLTLPVGVVGCMKTRIFVQISGNLLGLV